MLETAERLIISEIGDYAASLPGGPVTAADAAQLQQELIARVQRVFADVKAQFTPTFIGVDLASGTDKTVEVTIAPQSLQKYHTHMVALLIDNGVVTQPAQIFILQNALNTYLYQQKAGANETAR
ncbi:hypothetical protein [Rheinheimera maricola]|uniref:Uncharacterized protein n=1 Tax=Rheinheimera maricola TaxID=2793282 RepID=A0ABS7X6E8_9GAMM|nr:hypothetical protein [Rheinheimera maricola]MBZ9610769.1 hypothetical protein [Rheinheimera maricola]